MSDPRIEIFAGDITTLAVDAIVNAANERLAPGGGVCGAIHRAAGLELARACGKIGRCPTGEARITPGFELPANHVIHAVGPVWRGGGEKERGIASIAFPAISTGIYGFPLDQATDIAVTEVEVWLSEEQGIERVIFAVFGDEAEQAYRARLGA